MATIEFISGKAKNVPYSYWEPNFWRCRVPGEALKEKGHNVIYLPYLIEPITKDGEKMDDPPDIMVIHTLWDEPLKELKETHHGISMFKNKSDIVKAYKELYGTRIIYDMDDNILALMNDNYVNMINVKAGNLEMLTEGQKQEIINYLDIADAITATRDNYYNLLRQVEVKYNKRWSHKYHTLPNCLPNTLKKLMPSRDISFSFDNGRVSGNGFVMAIGSLYILSELNDTNYLKDLETLSYDNNILQLGKNSDILNTKPSHIKTVNFNLDILTYFGFLKSAAGNGNYNGMIRLLSANPYNKEFNAYKSPIKLLEAGITGMGLLIDDKASPDVYETDKLKDILPVNINGNTYLWIPPKETSRLVDEFRIHKHLDKFIEVYLK